MTSETAPLLADPMTARNSQSLGRAATSGYGGAVGSTTTIDDLSVQQAQLQMMQTYTAGEDASRLASAAKALGWHARGTGGHL